MPQPTIPKRLKKGKRREVLSPSHKPDHLTTTQWQLGLRSQAAQSQKLRVKNTGTHPAYSDFLVFNPQTKKEYRVAIRGVAPGVNYCSCPDYAVNTLGTCKHIEVTLLRLKKDKAARTALKLPYRAPYSEVYLRYGAKREVVFSKGVKSGDKLIPYARRFFNHENILTEPGVLTFDQFTKKAKEFDPDVRFYDDAMQFIAEWRDSLHRARIIDREFAKAIKTGGGADVSFPFIKTPLYRYQAQGAIFAARAGRCIIADEMGLGKTIQALAAIEIMAAHFEVEKVLVVCPTSLKFQWKMEIEKFCGRDLVIVEGQSPKRRASYESKAFYTIANYEQVYRDLEWVNARQWDVIILDETQRIKNWKALTSRAVKSLLSQYAIALTGTPLENRLEELHSIVSFIDRFKLGPLFGFWRTIKSSIRRRARSRDIAIYRKSANPFRRC
jgi:SNF2 family DNA or RNA helicase